MLPSSPWQRTSEFSCSPELVGEHHHSCLPPRRHCSQNVVLVMSLQCSLGDKWQRFVARNVQSVGCWQPKAAVCLLAWISHTPWPLSLPLGGCPSSCPLFSISRTPSLLLGGRVLIFWHQMQCTGTRKRKIQTRAFSRTLLWEWTTIKPLSQLQFLFKPHLSSHHTHTLPHIHLCTHIKAPPTSTWPFTPHGL